MKIASDYWEREPGDSETPAKSRRLPKLSQKELIPSDDFKVVADRISAALEIDRIVFSRLWGNWCGIKLGHFWQKRAVSKFTAYWMANILEAEHDEVFRIYSKWIERFHVDLLRPLLTARSADEIGVRKAAIGPFHAALLDDPLLQAVLHYEVFNGKAEVTPPRWMRKRENNEPLKLIVAHACRVLSHAHPATPGVRIEAILSDVDLKDPRTRAATKPTGRSPHLGGFNHYAYVAPLVTAMINDGKTLIDRDNAKDIYRRNQSSHLLLELESEPDRFLSRVIRGETLL
jgi:hypothetical protein